MPQKKRATRSIGLFGKLLILAFGVGLIALAETSRKREQSETTAERMVEGFSRLLAEQAERSIQAIDLTLLGLADALRLAPGLAPNNRAFQETMELRLRHLPYVRGLFVLNQDALVVHDTGYPELQHLDHRPYFQLHREKADAGLYIGNPIRSHQTNILYVGFSRRISNPDGSFAGVVVAVVEPRYFTRFYGKLPINDTDVVALILGDGILLARSPDHVTIGATYSVTPIRRMALERKHGVGWITSPIDGIRRLVGFSTITSAPVIVYLGLSEHTVYGAWQLHAALVAGGSFVVWVLTAGLAVLSHSYRSRSAQAQARLAQSQRLETVGRIAGGIAHDLGNTIKVARSTFMLLKPSLTAQSDAMALVEEGDRALKSAFEIIDRLLVFARRRELSPRPTDLAELVNGLAPMLRQAAGPSVELVLELRKAPRALVCEIDPIHLESALLNLVLNGKDAIPDCGRILIELREVQPPRRRHWLPRLSPQPKRLWAEIAVTDDGIGMPREVQERAFEPFYTTRSNGSGLGLSQVHGFVEQSAGEVVIESREGRGTTVRLRFPMTSPELKVLGADPRGSGHRA